MKRRIISVGALVLVSALLILAGCASKDAQRVKTLRSSMEEMSAVFNKHDFAKYATYFTDDFQWDRASAKTVLGRDDFIAFCAAIPKEDPTSYHFQARRLVSPTVAFADECAFVFTNTATGQRYEVFHADIHDFNGMLTRRMTTYSDGAAGSVALGQIEPTVPAAPLPGTRVWPTADPVPTKLKPMEAQKEALVRWNGRDVTAITKMLGPDAQIMYSVMYDPVNRAAYAAWMGVMYKAFPDLGLAETRSVDLGDGWVASEVTMSGTNRGSYLGHAATGKPFSVRAAYLARYDASGLMTVLHLYYDSLGILSQIGLTPTKIVAQK
jgi:ketosteroid isomerase-like protein